MRPQKSHTCVSLVTAVGCGGIAGQASAEALHSCVPVAVRDEREHSTEPWWHCTVGHGELYIPGCVQKFWGLYGRAFRDSI